MSIIKKLLSSWNETQSIYARMSARSNEWFHLKRRGSATVQECIEADFGKDGPKGLDIDPWQKQTITFKDDGSFLRNLFTSKITKTDTQKPAGYVNFNSMDEIYINPFITGEFALRVAAIKNRLARTLDIPDTSTYSHEFAHILQHGVNNTGWDTETGQNKIGQNIHIANMQKPWFERMMERYKRWSLDRHNPKEYKVATYYTSSNEIQARMHELLVHGHTQWQKMPQNKVELWAALHNFGITMPPKIQQALHQTQEGQEALQEYRILPGITQLAANTTWSFNRISSFIMNPDIEGGVFENLYPFLYGQLIEMYGDTLGRERMGFAANPRPAIEVIDILQNTNMSPAPELIEVLAAQIPPSQAGAFINKTIHNHLTDNTTMEVIKALVAREDVRKALFEPDTLIFKPYTDTDNRPPLHTSVFAGRDDLVHILMEAGARPEQKFQRVDLDGKIYGISGNDIPDIKNMLDDMQKNLDDPSRLPKRLRATYTDPVGRACVQENIEKIRRGYTAISGYDNINKAPVPSYSETHFDIGGYE